DSMLAKLIIIGADREQALARARRALAEFTLEGLPTVLPFHRAIVNEPAFMATDGRAFAVHTRWIETEFATPLPPQAAADASPEPPRQTVVVEVSGRRLEVSLPGDLAWQGRGARRATPYKHGGDWATGVSNNVVTAPMQGTVVTVAVSDGDPVSAGDLLVVLEAMKMENPVTAPRAGTVTGLTAQPGTPVTQGSILCTITP
ncbi:MAG: biotin/lipoyl-containing protein, partial [Pseudonocardiaceae bacterium]